MKPTELSVIALAVFVALAGCSDIAPKPKFKPVSGYSMYLAFVEKNRD